MRRWVSAAEGGPSGATTLLDDDPVDGAAAEAAAAVVTAPAPARGHVDWQLCVPFEAEVPSLDPTTLCGQAITPAALGASR